MPDSQCSHRSLHPLGCQCDRPSDPQPSALQAAIAELREPPDWCSNHGRGTTGSTLMAERDRYRAALEAIAAGDVPGTGDWGECLQAHAKGALA